MLGGILREMSNSPGPLSVLEIGRRLGIDRSALEGMLETLVRLGKLAEVSAAYSGDCRGCSGCGGCGSCGGGGVGVGARSFVRVLSRDGTLQDALS